MRTPWACGCVTRILSSGRSWLRIYWKAPLESPSSLVSYVAGRRHGDQEIAVPDKRIPKHKTGLKPERAAAGSDHRRRMAAYSQVSPAHALFNAKRMSSVNSQ